MKKSKFNQTTGLLAALAAGSLVVGCSNSGSSSSGGSAPTPVTTVANPITIDNAGTVPIIGDNATSSVIYVHNNSKQAISGISYKAILNTGSEKFIDAKSAALCATIPAGQSCPLAFTTPAVSKTVAQGSAMVSASYSYEKEQKQFSQLISFIRVDSKVAKGAQFNSGVMLNGVGNDSVYGTVYLYGSGEGKVYNVNSITSNKAAVKIIQGNITGKQLQSNYVSALEVSAPSSMLKATEVKSAKTAKSLKSSLKADPADPATYYATLTAASSLGSVNYSSTSDIGVNPVANGAILTAGNVPIIDSSVENPTGTLYITNAGNAEASSLTFTYPAGVTKTGGSCGLSLAPGAGCDITFTVPQLGGSGDISISYGGAWSGEGGATTLDATITWYNSKSEALLQMVSTQNPIEFNATQTITTDVTVTNIGGYNLTNMEKTQTTSGSATAASADPMVCTAEDGTTNTGTTLNVKGSCTYTVTVGDQVNETGTVKLGVSGSYQNDAGPQTYNRKLAVPYTSNAYRALLVIAPNPVNMPQIYGDGVDFATTSTSLTITNSGAVDATSVTPALETPPAFLTIDFQDVETTCPNNGTIGAGQSCVLVLKVGPTTNATTSNITGSRSLSVGYQGIGQTPQGATVADTVNYTILPNSQKLELTNVAATNDDSTANGNGSENSPYIFLGSSNQAKSVTLTYMNKGTNSIQISGINNTNSPLAWKINETDSSCYSSGALPSAAIAKNGTCTIVFDNVLANYAAAVPGGLSATFTENIAVPEIVFFDPSVVNDQSQATQFVVRPAAPAPISGNNIYATGKQATIVNAASFSGSVLTVSHTLANATGYTALIVETKMEDYFSTAPAPTLNGCTVNAASGVMTQTCTLDPSGGATATASVAYTADSAYTAETLHVLFKLTTGGYVVSFTPLSTTVTMP